MICGHDMGGGHKCQRKVKQPPCWQHGGKRKQAQGGQNTTASVTNAPVSQPPGSSSSQAKSWRRRRRVAPSPKPQPTVIPGASILHDPSALRWLVNETRRHTAGHGPGISLDQAMQNYHGVNALSRLMQPGTLPHDVSAVFTGGTCLALGHRIAERFSLDIDIVLVGGSQLSQGQRDEVLDAVGSAVANRTNLSHKHERRGPHFIRKDVSYQRTIEPVSVPDAALFIKTDTGFADHLPPDDIEIVDVDTYIALRGSRPFAAHYGDLSIPEVYAVKPRVTLAEKLIALHQRASVGERRALMSRARDVFDIGCLLAHEPTVASLQHLGSTPADIDARQIPHAHAMPPGTPAAKRRGIRRPAGGFADSPVWQDGHPMNAALRQAYNSSIGMLVYDRSKRPAFDAVMERVRANRGLL